MQHTRFNVYPAKAFHAQGNMRVAVAWLPISYDMHTYFNEYVHIYIYICFEHFFLPGSALFGDGASAAIAPCCLGLLGTGSRWVNIATKPSLMNGLPPGNLA